MAGFTKKITKNKLAPKDGSGPLTVIEFSLTNEICDSLKVALKGYKTSHKLGEIIENHMPQEIMQELSALSHEKGSPSMVYVIRNLPEITTHEIPKDIQQGSQIDLGGWFKTNSYTSHISKGIGHALKLKLAEESAFAFLRHKNFPKPIEGGTLHKHPEAVTMLGGIVTDGANTRFTDMQTLLEDPDAQGIPIMPEDKFPDLVYKKIYDWTIPNTLNIVPQKEYIDFFNDTARKHSQEIFIGPGDMAIWANNGRIFHQALEGDGTALPSGLQRAAISRPFNRT